jgi:hypothetical protein
MSIQQLCLFSSTPDMVGLNLLVKVLTGTPEELARPAVDWGYDGIEFMPNPEHLPDPQQFESTLRNAGSAMPVVNTGRMAPLIRWKKSWRGWSASGGSLSARCWILTNSLRRGLRSNMACASLKVKLGIYTCTILAAGLQVFCLGKNVSIGHTSPGFYEKKLSGARARSCLLPKATLKLLPAKQ